MNDSNQRPLVVLGSGGHASVLIDILLEQGREILAVVAPERYLERKIFSGIRQISSDEDALEYSVDDILLVNAIGMLPRSSLRREVNEYYLSKGYRFETIVSNKSMVSEFAQISAGAQVLPGAIVNAGAFIGQNTIVNSGSIVEHDCCIGAYNHIAPGATLSGGVKTQEGVFIGAGATIIHGISLSKGSIVGAGATLVSNLEQDNIAYPAVNTIKDTKS